MRTSTLPRSYHWVRVIALAAVGVLAIAFGPCAPTAAGDQGSEKAKPRLDRHGDALPEGARLRLGTERFRHAGDDFSHAVLFPDGDRIASFGGGYLMLFDAQSGVVINRMRSPENNFYDIAVTPDGKRLVTVGWILNGDGAASVGALRVWDARTLLETKTILWKERNTPHHVLVIADGKIAVTGDDSQVCLWDLEDAAELPHLNVARASALASSPDGKLLAIADGRGELLLWEWKTEKTPRRLDPGVNRRPQAVAFSPDGKTLAAANGYLGGLNFYNVESGKKTGSIASKQVGEARSIVFARDGKRLITPYSIDRTDGHSKRGFYIWDVATGKEERFITAAAGRLSLSRDGSRLLVGSRVWDTKSWKQLGPDDDGHRGSVYALAVSKSGLILSGSEDHTARLWDLKDGKLIHALPCGNWVRGVGLTPDGSLAATHSHDNLVVWDAVTGKARYRLPGHTQYGQHALGISDDGKRLLSFSSYDLFLRVTDLSNGKASAEHAIRPEGIKIDDSDAENSRERFDRDFIFNKGLFTPDGGKFVLAVNDQLRVFDVASGKEESCRFPSTTFSPCAISTDSRVALTVHRNPAIRQPNGRVAPPDPTETVRAFKIADGESTGEMVFKEGHIRCVACAADGKYFAAATMGTTPQVHLCKFGDDKPIRSFDLPALPGFVMAFAPDGKSLVVSMTGGSLLVYDVPDVDEK
jgi:WD40 repeat protein